LLIAFCDVFVGIITCGNVPCFGSIW